MKANWRNAYLLQEHLSYWVFLQLYQDWKRIIKKYHFTKHRMIVVTATFIRKILVQMGQKEVELKLQAFHTVFTTPDVKREGFLCKRCSLEWVAWNKYLAVSTLAFSEAKTFWVPHGNRTQDTLITRHSTNLTPGTHVGNGSLSLVLEHVAEDACHYNYF